MLRRRATKFSGALVGCFGCAVSGGPSGPYYVGDAAVNEAAAGAGFGGSAAGGASGSGASAGSGGTLGGSGAGGAGGGMACNETFCANDGTGSPCCVRPEGPCGMDRGSGCQQVPTGTGGAGTGGAGTGGAGGGGTGKCTYCAGTCSTITEDAACFVDCVGNQGKRGCIWQNKTCSCS